MSGATVLDVRPPPLRRRGAARARAAELADMTGTADPRAEVSRRKLVLVRDVIAMGAVPTASPVAGNWLADPAWWRELGGRLRAVTQAHAASHPLDPGLPAEAARQQLGLPDRSLVEALVRPPLTYQGGKIYCSPTVPGPAPKRSCGSTIPAGK